MKRIILNIIILAAVGLFLSGCYTVVWSPQDNFPTQSDYEQGYNDGYYNSPYYGNYGYYYNYPWWLNITPPAANAQPANRDAAAGAVRNNNGGRGDTPRDRGEIINTPPPAVNSGGSTSGGNSSVEKSSSKSGSSASSGRNSSSSSSDSNNVRNNNGGRNSGGRK